MTRLETIIMSVGAGQPGPENAQPGPEVGSESPLAKLTPQEQQIVKGALLDKLFPTPESREELNKLTPDQIDVGLGSWLSRQTPEWIDGFKNSSLEEDRRRKAEAQAAGGGGPPEGPRPPEMKDKEWETSPERGRWIVEKIIELETKPYAERYKDKTGWLSTSEPEKKIEEGKTYLDKLYIDLQSYVVLTCNTRQGGEYWDREKEYEVHSEENRDFEDTSTQDIDRLLNKSSIKEVSRTQEALPNDSFEELIKISDDTSKTEDERNNAQEKLRIYFREAKRRGYLKAVNTILTSIYQENIQGQNVSGEVEDILDRRIQRARQIGDNIFKRINGDLEISKFQGVCKEYISRAAERFMGILLTGPKEQQSSDLDKEGEFNPYKEQETGSRETYWRPSTYPDYYIVTATTPEQFQRAKESFLQMIIGGSLGRSPDKILPHLENFAKALGQAGLIQELAKNVKHGFMEELRQEFEGLSYIYGADYTNETYNPENYYKFMMALAAHEGPQRLVRLARAGQGQVGAFLWKFDNDPRIALFYGCGGSRGQISNDTLTQNYLQGEIKKILIEEAMGIQLKDHDPEKQRDPNRSKEKIEADTKVNLERIGIRQPEKAFKGLFEGFDKDEQDKFYGAKIQPKLGSLEQEKLTEYEEKLYRTRRVQQLLRSGKKLEDINKHDRKVYEDAYTQAKANFEVAFQMVGAMGEKVRRGGGVLNVDRNPYIGIYRKERKRLLKINDKDDLEKVDFNTLSENLKIGRLLNQLRDGRRRDSFSEGEEGFYAKISVEQKTDITDIVDQVPVHLAIQLVQVAETRTKILYSDESNVWTRLEFDKNGFIEVTGKDGKKMQIKTKAAYRTYAVSKARETAIASIKKNGLEATFELPKIFFDATGNVIGAAGSEKEIWNLEKASKSIYSLWSSNTYWGYQQENRHMLTAPHIIAAAKRIRAIGESQAEKEDPLAVQLLLLDPTLMRLRKLPGEQMQREIILFEAAVEESNYGHWRIDQELHEAFLPEDGDANEIRLGYNREDFGGASRFIITAKEYVASHPKRFSRRFASEIAKSPIHVSSYSDIVGQKGMMGLLEMFADPIGDIAGQRVAGQFSITKFVNQMRYGWMMFGALYGQENSEKGVSVEGLYEKPTNNSDKLAQAYDNLNKAKHYLAAENQLFYEIMETFGRLDTVLKLIRVMESDVRNAQGALLTEKEEVFLSDGRFNGKLAESGGGSRNTGSGRHSERVFFDSFVDWLMDEDPGGGALAYPSETQFYKHLKDRYWYFDKNGNKVQATNSDGTPRTWQDWLFDKMCR